MVDESTMKGGSDYEQQLEAQVNDLLIKNEGFKLTNDKLRIEETRLRVDLNEKERMIREATYEWAKNQEQKKDLE